MTARLALCLGLILFTFPTKAAQLALPAVPHYELPLPALSQPAAPPRYTENYNKGESKRRTEGNKNDQPKSRWERIKDDPVAFVTLCLAIVAGGQAALFVWQLILIKLSLNDAKIAANAARIGAQGTLETVKALRNAQRPYLSPFDPTLQNYDEAIRNQDASLVRIDVQLDITNVGPGVGFILSV